MKTRAELWDFLDSKDFEGLKYYGEEAFDIHKMSLEKSFSIYNIIKFWNIRFYPDSRHTFTAANQIYQFLKG